jgi:thiol-disulfide isomerase/thioredoxin
MIDNRHPRPYVKAMLRSLNSMARPLLLALLLSMLFAGAAGAGAVLEVNAANPGETLDLKSLAVQGKTTLIDVYSPFCPPCLALAPVIEKLAEKRPDLAIKKLNINRPDVKGIDWKSPLAQQYHIRSVPYFMILNPRGKIVAEGQAAMSQLKSWLQDAGLMNR